MIKHSVIENIGQLLTEKNINFLIGSGASTPFFPTLGNIEIALTNTTLSDEAKQLIYAIYFNKIIKKNKDLIGEKEVKNKAEVLKSYIEFIDKLTEIMRLRNSRLSPNRANIFTTNYDLFFEKAIDTKMQVNSNLFFNDGAHGYFTRILSSENYHKTISSNGVFDNYQKEIPMINLIKCHGSITWEKDINDLIRVNSHCGILDDIIAAFNNLEIRGVLLHVLEKHLSEGNVTALNTFSKGKVEELKIFFDAYKKLLIVNPDKSKFQHTVFNEYYYSMLRLLSYELEKDQSIFIVFGFSFADEHIANLVKRSLSNPFLQVYVFCYNEDSERDIKFRLGFRSMPSNIIFISPPTDDPSINFTVFNQLIFGGS